MHLTVALCALVATASPVPLASIGLQANQAQRELAESLSNTLALRMTQTGFVKVTTPSDVASVIGLDRQKQLLGCTETSCIAELAGALGARALVSGELARIGEVYQLTVKILDAQSATTLFSSLERHANAEALLAAVDRLGLTAATEVARHFGLLEQRTHPVPVVGLVGGGALALGGGILLTLAAIDDGALRRQVPTSYDAALAVKQRGELQQGVGVGLLAAGGMTLIGSLVWLLVGPRIDAPIALAPTPNGVAAWGTF